MLAFLFSSEARTEEGGQHFRAERENKDRLTPSGPCAETPDRGRAHPRVKPPKGGRPPYLDTLVVTRFHKITQKPHNYVSYTVSFLSRKY